MTNPDWEKLWAEVSAERDNLRALAETVCAFVDGGGRVFDDVKAGKAIRALRYALAAPYSAQPPGAFLALLADCERLEREIDALRAALAYKDASQ